MGGAIGAARIGLILAMEGLGACSVSQIPRFASTRLVLLVGPDDRLPWISTSPSPVGTKILNSELMVELGGSLPSPPNLPN